MKIHIKYVAFALFFGAFASEVSASQAFRRVMSRIMGHPAAPMVAIPVVSFGAMVAADRYMCPILPPTSMEQRIACQRANTQYPFTADEAVVFDRMAKDSLDDKSDTALSFETKSGDTVCVRNDKSGDELCLDRKKILAVFLSKAGDGISPMVAKTLENMQFPDLKGALKRGKEAKSLSWQVSDSSGTNVTSYDQLADDASVATIVKMRGNFDKAARVVFDLKKFQMSELDIKDGSSK